MSRIAATNTHRHVIDASPCVALDLLAKLVVNGRNSDEFRTSAPVRTAKLYETFKQTRECWGTG
jgi:hypothetical protein